MRSGKLGPHPLLRSKQRRRQYGLHSNAHRRCRPQTAAVWVFIRRQRRRVWLLMPSMVPVGMICRNAFSTEMRMLRRAMRTILLLSFLVFAISKNGGAAVIEQLIAVIDGEPYTLRSEERRVGKESKTRRQTTPCEKKSDKKARAGCAS